MWVVMDLSVTHVLGHCWMHLLNFSFAYLNTSFAYYDWLITVKANIEVTDIPPKAEKAVYSVNIAIFSEYGEGVSREL